MRNLIEPENTVQFLREHGISAKKRYGQNFLVDKRVLDCIIQGSGITGEDAVLEIGPGIGTLTQALCEAAGSVTAVEIDKDMLPLLSENLEGCDNYIIINADILKLDLGELAGEQATGKGFKVVANLPYYITTPIIMKLLEKRLPFGSITVMVQKEVADRMQAVPGGRDYGSLSLAVQYYSHAEVIASVPPSAFYPSPNVDSAVIRLDIYDEPPVKVSDEQRMFGIIRAAFDQRRKKLANAIANSPGLSLSRDDVESCLESMGIRRDIRGEMLSLQQFAELSDRLHS